MSEPVTNLADAVAEHGALPMPVGPEPQPLSEERLAEIAESHPGDWYSGEWRSEYVEATGDDESEAAYYRVFHQPSGAVLAELPDWAGPIALFIADAHDAVPELVAEVRRLLAERHETNESLSEAAEALRVQRDRIAELERTVRLLNTQRGDVAQLIERERGEGEECVDIDDLTAALALGSDESVEAGDPS